MHLLGGELQPQNQATLGRDATEMLASYFADFAVVGAGAISAQGQLMDYSREEAELHGLMLQSAQTSIVVADRQKFGRVAPVSRPGSGERDLPRYRCRAGADDGAGAQAPARAGAARGARLTACATDE